MLLEFRASWETVFTCCKHSSLDEETLRRNEFRPGVVCSHRKIVSFVPSFGSYAPSKIFLTVISGLMRQIMQKRRLRRRIVGKHPLSGDSFKELRLFSAAIPCRVLATSDAMLRLGTARTASSRRARCTVHRNSANNPSISRCQSCVCRIVP